MIDYPVPVTESLLQEITECIVSRFKPEKIIIFGSQAVGEARSESDIDLLVIMETADTPIERVVAVKRGCRPRFVAMDILVKTPEEVSTQLERGNFFLQQILTEGRTLYEREA